MELKLIVIILLIILTVYNVITYKPVNSETFGYGAMSLKSVVLTFISIGLFIFGLYLNEYPIYI